MFKIIPLYFFLALFIGFLYVYMTAPKPKIVIKYPTLENAGKITYVDDNNVCYRYQKTEIPCSTNGTQ